MAKPILLSALLGAVGLAASGPQPGEPFPPHRVVGNVYYVGSKALSAFLITTDQGHILVNTGFDHTVPIIRDGVKQLGFRFEDIRIILASHAHGDHVGGHASVKRATGAKVMVMAGDDETVRTGGRNAPQKGGPWEAVEVDHVLRDGEVVSLGDVRLTAHLTPGHTKGTTTWAFKARERGKEYDVVIIGGGAPDPDDQLVGDPGYPDIAEDYARMFRVLGSLACDVPLGPHGNYYDLTAKHARLVADSSTNPFVDPGYLSRAVPFLKQRFEKQLAAQQAAAKS